MIRELLCDPRYSISDDGTVYGVSGKPLKPAADPRDGYLSVGLWRNNLKTKRTIHSLVLETFVGPRPADLDVLHHNGDNQDNRLSNLRYGTRSENIYDVIRHGRHNKASRKECKNAHEYTPENTAVRRTAAGGLRRECRTCKAADNRRYRARQAGRTA